METNEIMTNEVMNVAEEAIINNSGKTLKTLGIVGGVLLVGGLAYKFAIKPMVQKIKDSRNDDDDFVDAGEHDLYDESES